MFVLCAQTIVPGLLGYIRSAVFASTLQSSSTSEVTTCLSSSLLLTTVSPLAGPTHRHYRQQAASLQDILPACPRAGIISRWSSKRGKNCKLNGPVPSVGERAEFLCVSGVPCQRQPQPHHAVFCILYNWPTCPPPWNHVNDHMRSGTSQSVHK